LGTFYKCGPAAANADCVKVLDPATEYDDKVGKANLFKTLGSIFLGVGLPFCGIAGMMTARCKKQRDEAKAGGVGRDGDRRPSCDVRMGASPDRGARRRGSCGARSALQRR
jgi:hypothetical protein